MDCNEFKASLHAYFHGHPPSEQVAAADRHARECGPCGDLMRVCRELSCREFVEFLADYLEGALPPERRAVFERHLAICPDCEAYLDSYKRTTHLGVEAFRGEALLPRPIPEDLIRAILAARGSGDR